MREVERRWRVRVGEPYQGGTASYVAAATLEDGGTAVVKIAMPTSVGGAQAFARSVESFVLADGRGCARLLAHDDELDALLLERLGRNLDSLRLPVDRQLEIICETVRQMWVPVPPETQLPTGAEKARWLADFIATTWERLERPCAPKTIDTALAFAEGAHGRVRPAHCRPRARRRAQLEHAGGPRRCVQARRSRGVDLRAGS